MAAAGCGGIRTSPTVNSSCGLLSRRPRYMTSTLPKTSLHEPDIFMREHYPCLFAALLVAGTGLLAGCVMGTLVALLDEFTQTPGEFVRVIRRSFPMSCNNCDRWILHRFPANLGLPYCT